MNKKQIRQLERSVIKTRPIIHCWRAFKTDHLCALNFDRG
jgi:hypothetical protein